MPKTLTWTQFRKAYPSFEIAFLDGWEVIDEETMGVSLWHSEYNILLCLNRKRIIRFEELGLVPLELRATAIP